MDIKQALGEKLYNQVQEKLKDTGLSLEGKIPYDRFNEVNTKKAELVKQVETLTAENENLRAENNKLTAQIKQSTLDSKVNDILKNCGARNINTLKKLIDLSNVNDTEESLTALTNTVNQLKQNEPYLFSNNDVSGNVPHGNNNPNPSISKDDFHKMSYEEKAALYKRDKALYDKLKGAN